MNRQVNDACQDGFDACQDGKPISCNPFNTLQPEYAEWDNGWRAADNYEPPEPPDYGCFRRLSSLSRRHGRRWPREAGSMTGYNLPPGCTDADVDKAFGGKVERHGEYQVVVKRTVEESITLWIDATSEDDARQQALDQASGASSWDVMDEYDYDIESVKAPEEEEDPDDERDARADWEFERNR